MREDFFCGFRVLAGPALPTMGTRSVVVEHPPNFNDLSLSDLDRSAIHSRVDNAVTNSDLVTAPISEGHSLPQ
jgi:hypothetical protein